MAPGDDYSLYGGTPPHARGSDTSRAAAESMRPKINQLQSMVLGAIRESGPTGLTCDQSEVDLGLRHQTASARIKELSQMGYIIDSEMRRYTRSGRRAVVWILNKDGVPAFQGRARPSEER